MNKEPAVKAYNRELVSRIYAGALNPSAYNDIFVAWDKHFQAVEGGREHLSEDFDWADEFVAHFEQAGKLIDQIQPHTPTNLEDTVSQLPYAAFLCATNGDITHTNHLADVFTNGKTSGSVFDLPLDPRSEKSLRNLVATLAIEGGTGENATQIIRVFVDKDEEPHVLICEALSTDEFQGLLVKSINATWNKSVENALVNTFGLTQAELELVGNLYKGLSIKEISVWRGRSQATLRCQLRAVLSKTNTKGQSALLRMVVSLVHMVIHMNRKNEDKAIKIANGLNRYQRRSAIKLSNGATLEYVESGDLDGTPFYYIQTSSNHTLTDTIVNGLARAGIRLISPVRPNQAQAGIFPPSLSANKWAHIHLEIIDQLGIDDFVCGGHREGGVYALALARIAKSRCKSVLLVCTGAPINSLKTIYAMHPGPRRLFLSARYFYKAIITPIKFIAQDFYSGPDGENRAVEYYCDGSPVDQGLARDPVFWKILRDNIAGTFENIPQLASDIAKWARDNSRLYAQVLKHTHIRFFHGAENLMMRPKHIVQFCQKNQNCSSHIVANCGQLLMYAKPELFIREIQELSEIIMDD